MMHYKVNERLGMTLILEGGNCETQLPEIKSQIKLNNSLIMSYIY